MTKQEFEEKVKYLQELKRMSEELGEEISSVEVDIKSYMTENNTDEVVAGPFKVTYKMVNRTKFDSATFNKDHPGLMERYTVPNPYKSLRVR